MQTQLPWLNIQRRNKRQGMWLRARRTRTSSFRPILFFGMSLFAAFFAAPVMAAQLLQAEAGHTAEARSQLSLQFDEAVQWRWFRLDEPQRVVIDVIGGEYKKQAAEDVANTNHAVARIRYGELIDGMRVVLDLRGKTQEISVAAAGPKSIVVKLDSARAPEIETPAPLPVQLPEPEPTAPVMTAVQRPVVVVIDAGHGGKDSGAVGPTGLKEKHVALSIAREVQRLLNGHSGYTVKLTRDADVFIPLRERIRIARESDADLFVSIHADAFDDRRAHGSSVYVLSNRGASSEYARLLARRENAADLVGGIEYQDKDETLAAVLLDISMNAAIEASADIAGRVLGGMRQLGPLHKRDVQRAGFVVLKSPDVPSILLETAFISNPREERNLGSRAHRRKIASALVAGIKDYFTEYRPSGVVEVARADAISPRQHKVRSGETLSGIADRYGVTLRELRASNALESDIIRIGQNLRIPIRTASR